MTEYVRVLMLQVAERDDGYSLSPWIPSEATLQCMLYSTKVMEMSEDIETLSETRGLTLTLSTTWKYNITVTGL